MREKEVFSRSTISTIVRFLIRALSILTGTISERQIRFYLRGNPLQSNPFCLTNSTNDTFITFRGFRGPTVGQGGGGVLDWCFFIQVIDYRF